MKLFLLLTMLFAHLVDDYYLQGFLASAKQKSWWKENAPDKLYRYDYIIALVEHAFSWTFVTMLIPAIYLLKTTGSIQSTYLALFILNWIIHAMIDNAKANLKKINLVQDQLFHIFQVYITWFCLIA